MTEIIVRQMPAFKKAYKRLHSNEKKVVDDEIKEIIKNPKIGTEKKGDLSGIFVHKFKMHSQEILLAYEWIPEERLLLALGVHENFYRDLKKSYDREFFVTMVLFTPPFGLGLLLPVKLSVVLFEFMFKQPQVA